MWNSVTAKSVLILGMSSCSYIERINVEDKKLVGLEAAGYFGVLFGNKLQFEQIYFQFGQMHIAIRTNTFCIRIICLEIWINTCCDLDQYILQFEQINVQAIQVNQLNQTK